MRERKRRKPSPLLPVCFRTVLCIFLSFFLCLSFYAISLGGVSVVFLAGKLFCKHTHRYTLTHTGACTCGLSDKKARGCSYGIAICKTCSLSLSPLLSHLHCCCRVVVVAAAVSLSAAEGLIRYVCEQVTSSA